MMNTEFLRQLGARLKAERKRAGLSQDAMARALGQTASSGHAYISRMESGKLGDIGLLTLTRYLQACKAPISRFILALAQSGAFGEAEQGMAIVEDRTRDEAAKRERARLRREQHAAREIEDANIVAKLWTEVLPAIKPLFPPGRAVLLEPYRQGVVAFYRAWRQSVRGALNQDPTLQVQMAFDRVEQAGIEIRLVPAAVHKMREIVFERLMAMIPRGGNI
jgi:transcriptional regulator with XRE-family HTH domain